MNLKKTLKRYNVAATMAMASVGNNENASDDEDEQQAGSSSFVGLVRKFININDLSVDLIDSVNPFNRAYEVLIRD